MALGAFWYSPAGFGRASIAWEHEPAKRCYLNTGYRVLKLIVDNLPDKPACLARGTQRAPAELEEQLLMGYAGGFYARQENSPCAL